MTKPYENMYFDTSGLADDEVIAATGMQKIRRVLALTAKERPNNVVFGTDYAECSIKKHIELVESLETDKRKTECYAKTHKTLSPKPMTQEKKKRNCAGRISIKTDDAIFDLLLDICVCSRTTVRGFHKS